MIEDPVTFVNAPSLAAERGVEASITTATESPNHRSVVDVRAVCSDGGVANVMPVRYDQPVPNRQK